MTQEIDQQAYIAITSTGFVDGACFTDSEDTARWVSEMESAGMRVIRVPRAEARRVVFTNYAKTGNLSPISRLWVAGIGFDGSPLPTSGQTEAKVPAKKVPVPFWDLGGMVLTLDKRLLVVLPALVAVCYLIAEFIY